MGHPMLGKVGFRGPALVALATAVLLSALPACHNPPNVEITFENRTSEALIVSIGGQRAFTLDPMSTSTGAEYISGLDESRLSVEVETEDGRVVLSVVGSKEELEREPIVIEQYMLER